MHNAPTGDAGSVTQDCIEAQPNDSATAAEYEGSCPPFLAPVTERSVGASYENRGHRLSHHRRRDAAEGAGAHQDVRMPVYRPQKDRRSPSGGGKRETNGRVAGLKVLVGEVRGAAGAQSSRQRTGGGLSVWPCVLGVVGSQVSAAAGRARLRKLAEHSRHAELGEVNIVGEHLQQQPHARISLLLLVPSAVLLLRATSCCATDWCGTFRGKTRKLGNSLQPNRGGK
jgi:hypothetical protein